MSADGQIYKMQLAPPVRLEVSSRDGTSQAVIDVLEANRMCAEAEKKTEIEAAAHILQWLAEKLSVPVDQFAESTAWEFYEAVTTLARQAMEARKKKAESIASSPVSIPASPPSCC